MLNGARSKTIKTENKLQKNTTKVESQDNLMHVVDDRDEAEGLCKFHMHNKVHMLCESCNEMICDKCLVENHQGHKTEDYKVASSNDFMVNIISNFYTQIRKNNDDQLKNFKDKIYDVDKMVDSFFNEELLRVEKTTKDLINLLNNLNVKVKKLIAMYQQKFKEEFVGIKDEYDKFQEELIYLQNKINSFKNNNIKGNNRFKEFKDFKLKKLQMETDFKRLLGFYDFNKSALISEFAMKDFHAYLDKNKIYLSKHFDEYSKLILSLNVVEKINSVINFDEAKMLFASKNYLPRNSSRFFQPIDRTNEIIIYDAESERYRKIAIYPKKLPGYSFLPFSRYINFNGRLFISGGYEDAKLSRTFWAVEDQSMLRLHDMGGANAGKYGNFAVINNEFYSNVNKNFIYEDDNLPNVNLIRCANMIHCRAGHALVGLSPSLILAFGGTEGNKTCEVFHFETNRWEEITPLNESRIDPSAFIYKNYVYVFFGFRFERSSKKFTFLDTIERISLLSMQNSEWEYVVPKMIGNFAKEKLPRSLCGISIKGNSSVIYLCGGQVDKEKYSSDIFEYNIELNTLGYSDKKLPKPTAFLEQNFVYIFKTGINFDLFGDVFYYHPSDNFTFSFQKI